MRDIVSFESPLTAVATPVTLNLDLTWPRCFVGIKLVDGSGVPVLGTSGSFAVTAIGPCSDAAQVIDGSPIVVPANKVLSFAMNATSVTVTPTSIVGAVQYKVVVYSNRS